MAFVTITCPQCGGQAQIEAGRSVMCPYCGREITAPPSDQGFAFAQDMQYAPPQQQAAVQFAPPPAQSVAQFAPQQTQDPSVFTQSAQQPYAAPIQQYHPQVLADAKQKRKNWYTINTAFMAFQTLLFAFGVLLASLDLGVGTALILTWLLSLALFAVISAASRPDDAYLDKKPVCKSKVAWSILLFLLSAMATSAVGAILFAILYALFG